MNKTILLLAIIVLGAQAETEWINKYESFTQEKFSDLQGWQQKNFQGKTGVSECGGKSLAGGYNVAGKGAALFRDMGQVELPAHHKVRITMEVHFQDSWDNEEFIVKVNREIMSKTMSNWRQHTQNQCGNDDWKERIQIIEFEMPKQSKIEIELSSTLNQHAKDESWAVRDIIVALLVDVEEEKPNCPILFSECNFEGIWQPVCDIDLDGETYSLEAVLQKFKNLALASGKNPSDFFQEIDMENMGQISNEEFVNVLLNLGLTNQDVQLVMQHVDLENSNDLVNWKDFLKKLRNYTINVRSVLVPEGQSVTLYEENNWGGELVVFPVSFACLVDVPSFKHMSQPSMNVMEVNHKTAKGSKQHHLRKQN